MSSRPSSPRRAHASRKRGQRAHTAATASRRRSIGVASAASSAASASAGSGSKTVSPGPEGENETFDMGEDFTRKARRYRGWMADSATEAAPEAESEKPEAPKPPTRLVLVRHAVTDHTGPLLSGRMPGID